MSIAVLEQVYEETRRVAIGGSGLAKDDFRLKKLIAPLDQSALKAPVFGQVAKAIDKAIASDEKAVSTALLDLASLVLAILYTQGKNGGEGTIVAIPTVRQSISPKHSSARLLQPVVKALTTKGSDRLSLVREAFEEGVFQDVRLAPYAIGAIEDPSADICDLMATKVLPTYGNAIYAQVAIKTDAKGKTADARRLKLLHTIDPKSARAIVLDALESGSKTTRLAATECLGDVPEDLPYLLTQAKSKAEDIRNAALERLGNYDDDGVADVLLEVAQNKHYKPVKRSIRINKNQRLVEGFCKHLKELMVKVFTLEDHLDTRLRLTDLMESLQGRSEPVVVDLLNWMYDLSRNDIENISTNPSKAGVIFRVLLMMLESENKALRQRLVDDRILMNAIVYQCSFAAGIMNLTPAAFYDAYAPLFIDPGKKVSGEVDRRTAIEEILSNPNKCASSRPPHTYGPNDHVEDVKYAIDHATWDTRWVDTAIQAGSALAATTFGDSKNTKLQKFLNERLDELSKTKHPSAEWKRIVIAMIDGGYPEAIDRAIQFFKGFTMSSQSSVHSYVYETAYRLTMLPTSSIPAIEAGLLELDPRVADAVSYHLATLKRKAAREALAQ